jgi:hypothetical protein
VLDPSLLPAHFKRRSSAALPRPSPGGSSKQAAASPAPRASRASPSPGPLRCKASAANAAAGAALSAQDPAASVLKKDTTPKRAGTPQGTPARGAHV